MVIQLQTSITIQPMMMVLIIRFLKVCLIYLISDLPKDSRLSKIDYSFTLLNFRHHENVGAYSLLPSQKKMSTGSPTYQDWEQNSYKTKASGLPKHQIILHFFPILQGILAFLKVPWGMHWKSHNPLWFQQCTWQYNRRESTTIHDIWMFILALETSLGLN